MLCRLTKACRSISLPASASYACERAPMTTTHINTQGHARIIRFEPAIDSSISLNRPAASHGFQKHRALNAATTLEYSPPAPFPNECWPPRLPLLQKPRFPFLEH